jgi:hypothetical protein
MFRQILAALIALAAVTPAAAHTPVLDLGAKSREAPYEIAEPEHSKAIFAELAGQPDFYRITSERAFDFYAGITVAKVEGCPLVTTFSLDVLDAAGRRIDGRDAGAAPWRPWYEEFGKTWYWLGPEIGADFKATRQLPAGTYYLKVHNAANKGRYVLAVGDQERFGLKTLLTITGTMREARARFWNAGCD